MKKIFFILAIFAVQKVKSQKKFFSSVGISYNTNHNVYSTNGSATPIIAKNKSTPYFDLTYSNRFPKSSFDIHLASKIVKCEVALKSSEFLKPFAIPSYYSSISLGFIKNYTVLGSQINGYEFGLGGDISFNLFQKFPFIADTLISLTNIKFYSTNSDLRIKANQKVNGSLLVQFKKRIYKKDRTEILNFKLRYQMSLSNFFTVNYKYNYDNNNYIVILQNRGNVISFIFSVPLKSFK